MIVGVNRYAAEQQEAMKVLKIDNSAVRRTQVQRLAQLRAGRDQARVDAALQALTACAASGRGNLLELSVEAARAQATVGEMSLALEKVFGRHEAAPELVKGDLRADLRVGPAVPDGRARRGRTVRRRPRPRAAHLHLQARPGRARPRPGGGRARPSPTSASTSSSARCSRRPMKLRAKPSRQQVDIVGAELAGRRPPHAGTGSAAGAHRAGSRTICRS